MLPWRDLGVDLVLECTGVFTTAEDLTKHVEAGAEYVVLSAPTKSEAVPTVVHGVNRPDGEPQIISCASCTTNCITPVIEVAHRRFGVERAVMKTVHAYTAGQQLVDGPSKNFRRGRAGAANLVPTSTGAAQATIRAVPELAGRFDGIAVRAPIPVGSVADIVFVVARPTTAEEINDAYRDAAYERYQGILGVSEDPLVSSDIVGDPRAAIVDLELTRVVDGTLVKVMAWYDNEWGFTHQMIREARAPSACPALVMCVEAVPLPVLLPTSTTFTRRQWQRHLDSDRRNDRDSVSPQLRTCFFNLPHGTRTTVAMTTSAATTMDPTDCSLDSHVLAHQGRHEGFHDVSRTQRWHSAGGLKRVTPRFSLQGGPSREVEIAERNAAFASRGR